MTQYKKGDRLKITKDPSKQHVIPVDKVTVSSVYKKTGRLKVVSDYGYGYMIGTSNLEKYKVTIQKIE